MKRWAVALAVAALLGACSGEAEPIGSDTTGATTTTAPALTTTSTSTSTTTTTSSTTTTTTTTTTTAPPVREELSLAGYLAVFHEVNSRLISKQLAVTQRGGGPEELIDVYETVLAGLEDIVPPDIAADLHSGQLGMVTGMHRAFTRLQEGIESPSIDDELASALFFQELAELGQGALDMDAEAAGLSVELAAAAIGVHPDAAFVIAVFEMQQAYAADLPDVFTLMSEAVMGSARAMDEMLDVFDLLAETRSDWVSLAPPADAADQVELQIEILDATVETMQEVEATLERGEEPSFELLIRLNFVSNASQEAAAQWSHYFSEFFAELDS